MRNFARRRILMLRMLLSFLSSDGGVKRAETIRKSGLFHHFGGGGYWHPLKIPADMKMISIGDRVTVCADVDFITHDLNHRFFNDSARFDTDDEKMRYYMGTITVDDDVMIGAHSVILYNTHIHSNSIIAAGSVVTHDVMPGTIVGGNPARVIGQVDELFEKRRLQQNGRPSDINYEKEKMEEYFWKQE